MRRARAYRYPESLEVARTIDALPPKARRALRSLILAVIRAQRNEAQD